MSSSSKKTRRQFIREAGQPAAAMVLAGSMPAMVPLPAQKLFIHHVFFWLKNHDSKEDRDKLVEGLHKLSKVKTILQWHMGEPAATNRDVIDRSYNISWCLFFKDKADQDSYQADPIHLDFVKDYSPLWARVVVYDAEDV